MPYPSLLEDTALTALLHEDAPYGDLTTRSLDIGEQPGRMRFYARGPRTVACAEEAARMIALAGAVRVHQPKASGERAEDGELLLEAHGPAGALHLAWKTAQTLMEYAAGIATSTQAIVEAAASGCELGQDAPVVACTRKNLPGTRAIAQAAVTAGGGTMHRLGLSETLLVFPEHRAFLAASEQGQRLAALARAAPEKRVVVEVPGLEEALEAAAAGAEVLQLEKCPPEDVAALAEALQARDFRGLIAVAGGVSSENAGAYAQAGAAVLVTSSPYFAAPRDVSVQMEPA